MIDELSALAASVSLGWLPSDIPEVLEASERLPQSPQVIGHSRESQPLYGLRIGQGPKRLALLAGAHADEPVGPATLLALARWLLHSSYARPLLERATFTICPHVNPDGALRNASWSVAFPCPIERYVENVERELPGDDVEFGYPRSEDDEGARPENIAVARFLSAGGPYSYHASLHGMAIAEGAWFLLDRNHIGSTATLRRDLAGCCERLGVPLHDQDRGGEKGFTRIGPGFATTPTSIAMREFFAGEGDAATAALFRPSSMELVESLGGYPLCSVSEIPLYTVTQTTPGEALGANFAAARAGLLSLRAASEDERAGIAADLRARFGLEPFPIATAARLILALVLLGSGLLSPDELVPPSGVSPQ